MKVNLKKLGAIVAGAAVLASSAAFAGLMFGSTTLVDDNGAPVAKVVVGSKALPSDAVAAALIANKIASETYKSQTLTAQVAGSADCKSGAASNASAGTCQVSNKKAQLQITVPGSVAAGTYTFGNLIGDYVNRDLSDRIDNVASSDPDYTKVAYPMGGSDTSDNANPFTDGTAGGNIGPSDVYLYRISGAMYSGFADYTVNDQDGGNTYVEHQDMWVDGQNSYSTSSNQDVGKVSFLAYTLKFDGPGGDTEGIPVCTRANNLDYQACLNPNIGGVTTDDETAAHRVKISFLGDEWVISEMSPPDVTEPSDNVLHNGGYIKLAKESIGGILNQGESLPVDNLKFQLDDLEALSDGTTAAIMSVLDANGNILTKDKINQGETKEFNVAGKNYRIHVYKVAPGYTFGAKWADMAVYSNEMELRDGQQLDQDVGLNPGYTVALGWKNLDASSQNSTASNVGDPTLVDTLRTIVIYSDSISDVSSSADEELKVGDYVPLVSNPAAWKLSYKGLDLTSSDKSTLKFEIKTDNLDLSKKFPDTGIANTPFLNDAAPIIQLGHPALAGLPYSADGVKESCTIYAPYLRVSSSTTGSVFEATANTFSSTTLSNNEFYVPMRYYDGASPVVGTDPEAAMTCLYSNDNAPLGASLNPATGDEPYSFVVDAGSVVMKLSPSSSDYDIQQYSKMAPPAANYNVVQYSDIGDGSTSFAPPDGGAILIQRASDVGPGDKLLGDMFDSLVGGSGGWAVAGQPDMMFAIAEKAGSGTSNDFVDYTVFGTSKDKAPVNSPSDSLFQTNFYWGLGGVSTLQVTSDNEKVFYGHATPNAPDASTNCIWAPATTGAGYYCAADKKTGPVTSNSELAEQGYVTERGSTFQSMDDRTVQFQMAQKLATAQWFLAPSDMNASSSDQTIVTLGEGESTTVSGVTVQVLAITEDVGACSATGAAASCTADMSGVSAVIMPNNAASVSVSMPYTGDYGNLVVLDSDATGVNTLISVGGDQVNSVTANLLQGSTVDWTATPQVVKEVVQGSKIVVAGATAQDTLAAAQSFVSQVKRT